MRSGLLLVVVYFAEFCIDDIVLGLRAGLGAAVARRAARLLGLIHGLAKLHLRLHQVVGAGLDRLDVLSLQRRAQGSDRRLDGAASGLGDLVAIFVQRLFRVMRQRFTTILGVDHFAPLLVLGGVGFFVLHHLVDVGFAQAARGLDANLLLLVGRLVLGGHVDDAIGVDVEGHLDLRHAARRAWNPD